MAKYLKPAAFLGVLIAGLVFVAQSPASVVFDPINRTIDTWGDEPVTDQDKKWTLIDTNLNPNTAVQFFTTVQTTQDVHSSTLNFVGSLPVGTFFIDYSIEIVGAPLLFFKAVSMDTTVPDQSAPGVTVVKLVDDDADPVDDPLRTLTSKNGVPSGLQFFPPLLTKLWVHETFTVPTDGLLTNATNTYTQAPIPEPASVLLWLGLGGTAAVVCWWRRRKR